MNDTIWNNLTRYSKTHAGAVKIMLPPPNVYDNSGNINFDVLVSMGIGTMLRNAMFYGWEQPLAEACRDFCHICMVDPMLVEAYCGMRFEQLCASAYDDIANMLTKTVITADGKPFQPKAFL
jgi:hypothetical protein